jgi:hypothetical protein
LVNVPPRRHVCGSQNCNPFFQFVTFHGFSSTGTIAVGVKVGDVELTLIDGYEAAAVKGARVFTFFG